MSEFHSPRRITELLSGIVLEEYELDIGSSGFSVRRILKQQRPRGIVEAMLIGQNSSSGGAAVCSLGLQPPDHGATKYRIRVADSTRHCIWSWG